MAKITVLGSGGWGMALALSAFANRNEVTLWSPFIEEVENLQKNKQKNNQKQCFKCRLPDKPGRHIQ